MKNLSPDLGGKVYSRKYEDEVHTVKLTGLSSSKMGKPQEESEDVEEEIVLKEESLLKCPDWDGDTWEDSSLVVKKFGNSFNRNEITANDLTSDGSMSDDCRSLRTKCSDASIFIPQSSSMKTERVPLSTELNDSCCPSSQVCNSHDCDPSVSNECVKGLGPGRKVSQETVGNVHCKCCLCHSNVTNPSNICNGEVHPNFNTSQNSISNDCTVQTAKPHIGSQTDLSSETTSNNKNCSPVHIETLLENIPLAYSPRTKQLHIISVKPESKGNTHSCEAKTVEAEQVENCGRALESITEAQENDPEADVIINIVDKQDSISYDSPRNTLQRVGTCTSLTRTDDSSFSSISSLSTNTDFSTSAPSAGDDASDCRSNAFDCEDSVFSEGIHHSRKPYDTSHGAVNQGAKPKRGGITGFLTRNFFSWRSKDPSPHTPGWKLFTKGSQHHIPVNCEADQINEESDVSEDSGSVHLGSPDFNKVKHKLSHLSDSNTSLNRKRSSDFVPSSTTALILENRPAHLPAKSLEEEQRHRQQYEQMVEAARKKELKEAKVQKKLLQQQLKQENLITQAVRIWNNDVLPNWETMKTSRKARDLWWQGLPPSVRGKVWKLAVGNELHITSELYEICVNRARDRIRMASESASISEDDPEESSPDKEGSVDLIKLDVSRTFPQLCIFQKGGPYYDLLHSLLGAYVCYRPDVGYVQGMSFLAAVLILNLDVADSFICFANLLNKPCQLAFFRLDESMMKSYFKTYEEFFKENLPKLFRYFEKLTLSPDLYLIDWIYTLYSKSLPLDVACRVWDVFFRDGEEFLFRTALGILNLYQEVLVNMEFIHLAQFLTRLPEDILSESLFHSIETIRMAIDKKRFAQVLALNIETSDT